MFVNDMDFPVPLSKFAEFLCAAKRATYAAKDDTAKVKPVLPGSHHLKFRQGALFYQDIYYGGDFFVGQETVFFRGEPTWAMCYAGGINEGVDTSQTPGIYEFLQDSLRRVSPKAPYRGPESYASGEFRYTNRFVGEISRFSGVETISLESKPIYQLHYNGGMLKD